MIEYIKEDSLHIVTMNDGANTICPAWQNRMLEILDALEGECKAGAAMVFTGVDKFFSNGLNLEVVAALAQDDMAKFGAKMAEIHRRMLTLPFPTVAAVNGHAFAGGAFLALSCDYRIMREDRGWICISEVDAGVPLPPAMIDILRGKLPPNTVRDAVLTGKRYAADEAIACGFSDGKASADALLDEAIKLATSLATKEPGIFKTIKQAYFGPMAEGLR